MRSWIKRYPAPCTMAGIALFGFLLRLPWINYCMTPDEAFAFDCFIRNGFRAIVFGPYGSGNHVLYTVCTWIAYSLFGMHDWAFQLPSLIFGMGGILLAYPVGTALFGSRRAGLAGAFFLACAPFHVAYSANARGYSAIIFFALLSALFIDRDLRRPSVAGFVGLALATFLMGMSQVVSVVLMGAWGAAVGVSAVCFVGVKKWRTRQRLFALIITCAALGTGLALINVGYSPAFSLLRGIWLRVFQGHWPPDVNNFLCGAEQTSWPPFWFWRVAETNTGLRGELFWAASLVALIGILVSAARKHWGALIALAGVVCPFASYIVFGLKMDARYTIIILPFWVLAFSAGVVWIADAVGWCASRMPLMSGPVARIFPRVAFAGIAIAYCVAIFPLYSKAPALACSFNDYKSAVRYLAAHMDNNDIVAYDAGISHSLEHYLNRYVFPALQPGQEPSRRPRVWLFSTQQDPADVERLLPGYQLALTSSFDGCIIWSGEFDAPNLHQVDLAPFQFSRDVARQDRLAPWIMSGMSQDIEIETGDTIEDVPSRCLQVTTATSQPDWRLYCPPQPCPPSKLVLFRADTRGDAGLWATGVFLRFYDDQHNQIEERVMRVPCKAAPGSMWKRLQLARIAPQKARYVSVGLLVSRPSRPGRTTAFRNVELWIDEPPAPVAPSGT